MRFRFLLVFVCVVVLLTGSAAQAVTPGTLDKSFSKDGLVRSSLLASGHPSIVQVDSQQRVMVGGFDANVNQPLILRFSPTGAPDTTWGHRHLGTGYGDVVGMVMSGSNIVVGTSEGVVARLKSNGTLDGTFGTGGYVQTNGAIGLPTRIVAIGINAKAIYAVGPSFSTDAYLYRITLDGTSYVANRLCVGAHTFSSECGGLNSLTVSESFVYVGGYARVDGSEPDSWTSSAVVGRFKPGGKIDTTYGQSGYAFLDPCGDCNDGSWANGLAVSPSTGDVYAVGPWCGGYCPHDGDPFLGHFDASGALQRWTSVRFGDCGDACSGGGSDNYAAAVTLDAGSPVVVGTDDACDEQYPEVDCLGIVGPFPGSGHISAAPFGGTSVRFYKGKILVAGGQYVARLNG